MCWSASPEKDPKAHVQLQTKETKIQNGNDVKTLAKDERKSQNAKKLLSLKNRKMSCFRTSFVLTPQGTTPAHGVHYTLFLAKNAVHDY